MKTKAELEWVTGENPVTGSTKLVSIIGSDGARDTSFAYCDLEGVWRCPATGYTMARNGFSVEAWAAKPTFEGVPQDRKSQGHESP